MEQAVEQPRLAPYDPPDIQEAWRMVSGQLQLEMKQSEFNSWVRPVQAVSFKEGVFRLAVVNAYARAWVEDHLRTKITRLLEGVYNQPLSVSFLLAKSSEGYASAASIMPATEKVKSNGRRKSQPEETGAGAVEADEPVPAAQIVPGAQIVPEVAKGSPRKIQLQRAYGTERARVVQPERAIMLTMYFLNSWLPLLGQSAMTTILAARSLCYWNPLTGEKRNVIETDMSELARRASVSLRTVKDVLSQDLVKRYFLRYKVRRVMTAYGVRTAGIILQVRMDDPLTPEDQDAHNLPEEERWYTAEFEDEDES